MLNIWAAKSRPLRSQPDRRGDRRDLRDAARSFIAFLAERRRWTPPGMSGRSPPSTCLAGAPSRCSSWNSA
ncbi:hypothetical protein ACFQFG_18595 [Methylobacterium persicinum]